MVKTMSKDRRLLFLLGLPLFSLAELVLGFTHKAPPFPHPHYTPAPLINEVLLALFFGNIVASIAALIWLKGFRRFVILISIGNFIVNLIVTEIMAFMIAGVGF
jgi:hypothetical protein